MKKYLPILFKGMAMGAADVIPGVSGGTIAFITGIYDKLLESISKLNFSLLVKLKEEGVLSVWKHINGNFLAPLFIGMAISIASLAKLMTFLLENQPIKIWSFFFGLILASSVLIAKSGSKWKTKEYVSMFIGVAIAYYITIASPTETTENPLFVIFSGILAISALILPGISGSFILLLLGKYHYVMDAISSFDIKKIALIGIGAIIGLLTFSKVLSWLLSKYRSITLALLTGFMIGSLNKVWPWKKVISTRINSKGKEVTFLDESILPSNYDGNPEVFWAILFAILGIGVVGLLFLSDNREESEKI